MGRVRTNIRVEGKDCWTLFDSGARNTYIVEDCVGRLTRWKLSKPEPAALGGKHLRIRSECVILADIERHPVRVKARVVPEIGLDEERHRIQILFGALAMQEWGIKPDVVEERLDLTCYPREFVEF